jgi:hypothetical protein
MTAAAQAGETAVYAEITLPTPTTWQLWLTETTNWDGNPADMTPSGFGICKFLVNVTGVTTASKATPPQQILYETYYDPPMWDLVGFPDGPNPATVDANGAAQAFAGQDDTLSMCLFYGFGVTAGNYVLQDPTNFSFSGSYSWTAPGSPGSATPGVLVFKGKRLANNPVSIVWSSSDQAFVFNDTSTGLGTIVPVVPEPATVVLLALAGTTAMKRRRR